MQRHLNTMLLCWHTTMTTVCNVIIFVDCNEIKYTADDIKI